jgi:hypothetical protein
MAGWQEKNEGRIGNTAEIFDAPAGHFFRSPSGRGLLLSGFVVRRLWVM